MQNLLSEIKAVFKGEISADKIDRLHYSHDASIYQLIPEAVLFPKNSADIKNLVKFVASKKYTYPTLSITPRSAGTDMSGGAIGNSLLIDMTKHFTKISSVTSDSAHLEPGVFYRDFDPLAAEQGGLLGCVPASRMLCTVGGMVANNSGGEQSLRYGNTENFVTELKVVFAEGNEYDVRPLNRRQLNMKMKEGDYEGELYRRIYDLIEANYDTIKNARPHVSKNSMGYNLWSVWDRETGIFDMTKLITGSQGTLGIITDIKFKLVPRAKHSGLLVVYLPTIKQLGEIIPAVMKHHPASFEGFDEMTFELGIKYFKLFRRQMGATAWLQQQAALLSSVAKFRGHLPSMVLMVEFEGNSHQAVQTKIAKLQVALKKFKLQTEIAGDEISSSRFWQIRRAAFDLLHERVKAKYASPFIDDLTVQPKYLHEFLPKLRAIIRKYNLPATIQGHLGDGNFHIIPLLDIAHQPDQLKLEPVMREIVPLVLQYHGTLAGEHNDGMVRGPWLPAVFGKEMYQIFRETKEIFDPMYIFNPHKKTDASWDFSMDHIRTRN